MNITLSSSFVPQSTLESFYAGLENIFLVHQFRV
uniref:Uncharacterized protein n=1 Tax=Musa acuminata subsp. malaccensis TaxID=214687 RepID=A0A804I2C9_MUSAM